LFYLHVCLYEACQWQWQWQWQQDRDYQHAFVDDDGEWWYSSYCKCIRHPFVYAAIIQQCWWFEIKKALHLEITAVPSYNPPINAE